MDWLLSIICTSISFYQFRSVATKFEFHRSKIDMNSLPLQLLQRLCMNEQFWKGLFTKSKPSNQQRVYFFKVMNEKKKKVPHSGYRYFNIISIKQDLEWILQRHIKNKILHIVLKIFTYKYFFVINRSILIHADEIMWTDAHSYQNIFDILTSKLSNWTKQYKIQISQCCGI